MRMRHIWPVRLYYIFFTLSHKRHDFRGWGNVEHRMFSLCDFCRKHFSFGEEFSEIQTYVGLYVMYRLLLSDITETSILSTNFSKVIKFHESYQFSWKLSNFMKVTNFHDLSNFMSYQFSWKLSNFMKITNFHELSNFMKVTNFNESYQISWNYQFSWVIKFHETYQFSWKLSNFMKISLVGTDLFHEDGRTDRQTDMSKLIVVFLSFANGPKK
jgi:hypothetical protein